MAQSSRLSDSNQSLGSTFNAIKLALEQVREAVVILSQEGSVIFCNSAAIEMFNLDGVTHGIGLKDILTIVHHETGQPLRISLENIISPSFVENLQSIALVKRSSRVFMPFSMKVNCVYEDDKGLLPNRYVLTIRDESESVKLKKSVDFHRKKDSLTGLDNRTEFEFQLQRYIADAKQNHHTHSLCVINIDQTKVVNNAVGHLAGDELLKMIANHLKETVRANDVLARVAGDEFTLLLWQANRITAEIVAHKITEQIGNQLFEWQDKSFVLSVSIGISEFSNDEKSWIDVLSQADSACSEAKRRGRNTIKIYQSSQKEILSHQNEIEWISRIVSAAKSDQFQLFQQKIISLKGDVPSEHCEVLIRMKNGEHPPISPALFLPAAERYDMVNLIDRWVVMNTLDWLAKYPNLPLNQLNINLSGKSITRTDFLNFIAQLFNDNNIDTSKICFEITETSAIANFPKAREFIRYIKSLGCQVALDDFGSGMSSFAYLKNLPVDFVKIDGEFIRDLNKDDVSMSMVRAINEVAHSMGLKTVAEYVENEAIFNKVQELGIDYAQGYLIAKPQPISELLSSYSYHQLNSSKNV